MTPAYCSPDRCDAVQSLDLTHGAREKHRSHDQAAYWNAAAVKMFGVVPDCHSVPERKWRHRIGPRHCPQSQAFVAAWGSWEAWNVCHVWSGLAHSAAAVSASSVAQAAGQPQPALRSPKPAILLALRHPIAQR